jgi:hypothetical protein
VKTRPLPLGANFCPSQEKMLTLGVNTYKYSTLQKNGGANRRSLPLGANFLSARRKRPPLGVKLDRREQQKLEGDRRSRPFSFKPSRPTLVPRRDSNPRTFSPFMTTAPQALLRLLRQRNRKNSKIELGKKSSSAFFRCGFTRSKFRRINSLNPSKWDLH